MLDAGLWILDFKGIFYLPPGGNQSSLLSNREPLNCEL